MRTLPRVLAGITLAASLSLPAYAGSSQLPNYKSLPLVKTITSIDKLTEQGYLKEWYDENPRSVAKHPHFVATYLICEENQSKKPTGVYDSKTGDSYFLTPKLDYRKVTREAIRASKERFLAEKKKAKETGDDSKLMALFEKTQENFEPAFKYCDDLPENMLVPRTRTAENKPYILLAQKHL